MKVALITGTRKVEIADVDQPHPGYGEIAIEVKACSLCTWEQRVYTGSKEVPLPFLGGHELAGVVVEKGPGVGGRLRIGDKVTACLVRKCNECYYCRTGADNICVDCEIRENATGIAGMGGLSEYLIVPSFQAFKLDDGADFVKSSLSEPLACVIHSIERADIQLADDVVIVGAGTMGLLHVMLAKMRGARVIVVEPDSVRRDVARKLGASCVVDPRTEDPEKMVKELSEGRGAEVVIHTTASSKVAEDSLRLAGKRGRIIYFGSFHPNDPVTINPNHIHYSELVLTGSISPSSRDFAKAAKLISTGIVDPTPVIDSVFDFKDIDKAFERAVQSDSFRVVVKL